jgi:cobyrinic acid a,c-diamide synthase
MAALRQRGLAVQPFKCGPDFLDGSHHTAICGRPSRNLDTWMLDLTVNQDIFDRACRGADVAIVEGMMGLFDGVTGCGEQGSSAEIAKMLDLPVVLVLDASKSARSIAAIVKGFEIFDPELRFAGVVLNGVAGEGHYRILKEAIASTCTSPILGWLPRNPEVAIAERYLGLHGAIDQIDQTEERVTSFASFAEAHLDLDRLMRQNYAIERIPSSDCPKVPERQKGALVGVARDRAFSFYYEDNFDVLRECGAEIVEFSPLADSELPDELDAVYLGGGYPELYARTLSENQTLLASLRAFAAAGKPIYAECGGMMYLAQTLTDLEGESFPMAYLLPLSVQMNHHARPQLSLLKRNLHRHN